MDTRNNVAMIGITPTLNLFLKFSDLITVKNLGKK